MEKLGMYNVQQDLNIKPVRREEMPVEKIEKPVEIGEKKQADKNTENHLGKVIIKQVKQLPKAFEEMATAVELAAKEKYMDRRNVAQKRFGCRGNFLDITV